jgi:hypothetical protein
MKIKEMLDRRTDLSTFVVHSTRRTGDRNARANLESILRQRRIRAVNAMGAASEFMMQRRSVHREPCGRREW